MNMEPWIGQCKRETWIRVDHRFLTRDDESSFGGEEEILDIPHPAPFGALLSFTIFPQGLKLKDDYGYIEGGRGIMVRRDVSTSGEEWHDVVEVAECIHGAESTCLRRQRLLSNYLTRHPASRDTVSRYVSIIYNYVLTNV